MLARGTAQAQGTALGSNGCDARSGHGKAPALVGGTGAAWWHRRRDEQARRLPAGRPATPRRGTNAACMSTRQDVHIKAQTCFHKWKHGTG